MYTLGINAAFHDPSACLVHDGLLVAAAEEERFTRIKHGKRPIPFSTYELPFHAIHYCLRFAGIQLGDVDHVAYSFDPSISLADKGIQGSITLPVEPSAVSTPVGWESPWDGLFLSSIVNAPRHLFDGAPHHLAGAFRSVSHHGRFRWHFVPHHLAHAASAFLPSPFEESAILTLDGRGERATTGYAAGCGDAIRLLSQVDYPHSLGLLYEHVTEYLGFLRASDEYKVMALASFGRPAFLREFRDMIRIGDAGQYEVLPLPLEELFGPRRDRGEPLEGRHCDIARSLQDALEETVLKLAAWLHGKTGSRNLCLAGGVALNCVLNARLRDESPFDRIWVQPAAGDAGTAPGAALYIDGRESPGAGRRYRMDDSFLGPEYPDGEIEDLLIRSKIPYRRPESLIEVVVDHLVDDHVVGWFQGRMEFGPRALGARSILASPLHASMQARLNEIKDREDFRPVAPVVLEEAAEQWFEGAEPSPYMLFVYSVLPGNADLIPAVRHVDGSARIQTINQHQHPLYYELVRTFGDRTGVPVLINTSFNTRGEPIVCSPRDALESFWTSPLDALAIGPFLVEKTGEQG